MCNNKNIKNCISVSVILTSTKLIFLLSENVLASGFLLCDTPSITDGEFLTYNIPLTYNQNGTMSNHLVTLFKAAPEDDKDLYVETLQSANIACQTIPVIEFKFCNLDVFKEKLSSPEKYSGLILSSPRCVSALKHCLSNNSLHSDWKNKPCFAVGPATEKLARNLFDLTCIGSESGKGANLAPIIIQTLGAQKDLPLLMPTSNLALDNIGSALSKENIPVDAPTVYETITSTCLQERVSSLEISLTNILVFFSPSGAKSAIPLLDENVLGPSKVISIGTTTGDALTSLGVTLSGVCPQPTPESLLALIQPMTHGAS